MFLEGEDHSRTVILTRSRVQALVFEDELLTVTPHVSTLIAPLRTLVAMPHETQHDNDKLIFTSANAVDYYEGEVSGKLCYIVGEKTANAARARGAKILHVAMNVAELIAKLVLMKPKKFTYPFGIPQTSALQDTLPLLGHDVVGVQVYRAETLPWSQPYKEKIASVSGPIFPVFSTQSALTLIESILDLTFSTQPIIVPFSAQIGVQFTSVNNVSVTEPPQLPQSSSMIERIQGILNK